MAWPTQDRWSVGVRSGFGWWRSPERVHVEPRRDDRVRLLPALVVERSTVCFERVQQRHHLTEDLLVCFSELRERLLNMAREWMAVCIVKESWPTAAR